MKPVTISILWVAGLSGSIYLVHDEHPWFGLLVLLLTFVTTIIQIQAGQREAVRPALKTDSASGVQTEEITNFAAAIKPGRQRIT